MDEVGHAICVSLRGEVYAAHQERTMLETTFCCGTLDYYTEGKTMIGRISNAIKGQHHMTCLTVKGMIMIFCEHVPRRRYDRRPAAASTRPSRGVDAARNPRRRRDHPPRGVDATPPRRRRDPSAASTRPLRGVAATLRGVDATLRGELSIAARAGRMPSPFGMHSLDQSIVAWYVSRSQDFVRGKTFVST